MLTELKMVIVINCPIVHFQSISIPEYENWASILSVYLTVSQQSILSTELLLKPGYLKSGNAHDEQA